MIEVHREQHFDTTPEAMWGRIGDFHGAASWHPAIASSEPVGGDDVRALTLQDGAKIVETREASGEFSYGYRIDESPLPVREYHATLAVVPAESGCDVTWDARFEPEGASEEEARELVGGIFDAGLNNL